MNAPLPEAIRKALESATLDDKYTRQEGRIFLSGVQALVRLPLMQAQAGLSDAAAGWLAAINYLGYMSGALLAARLPWGLRLLGLPLLLPVLLWPAPRPAGGEFELIAADIGQGNAVLVRTAGPAPPRSNPISLSSSKAAWTFSVLTPWNMMSPL